MSFVILDFCFRFADLHCCQDLLTATECYIECHFTEVLECDEFYNLTADQECLSS